MSRQKRRGAAAIEFALVAPVAFTLLYGIAEYSWYMFNLLTVTTAVQEGVRTGSFVAGADDPVAATTAKVREQLTAQGLPGDTATVTTTMTTDSYGDVLTVRAQVPYTALVGLIPTPAMMDQRASAVHEGDIGTSD